MYLYSRICIVYSSTNPWYIVLILQCRVFTKFLNLNTKRQLKPFYIFLEFPLELTSWVKLQVEIFCKASRRRALQKISTCSLTHDVSSLEDDNVFVFCVAFFLVFVFYIDQ
jgi:hypothetical protein